ncbi:MAG: glycosyltransferase family 2 protein [Chloroflexota bacterium]|nr:glycosyltransferase family 2 protein [Chloroflexota bacterium]
MTNNKHMDEHPTLTTRPISITNVGPNNAPANEDLLLEIGILTIGKPTLSMALSSLLLQDERRIRIHIVDTAPSPIINRPEVQCVLRLAADREIRCTYEHVHDDKRAFSTGKLAIIETLSGPNICFMDDDVVMPSQALATMLRFFEQNPVYGWLAPYCKNAGTVRTALSGRSHYSPGGVFYQDKLVRNILLEYYETTVDVLDKQRSSNKVWEIAFLTELFPLLGRTTNVQNDNVIYHLDYHERPNWDLLQEDLVRTSRRKAEELVGKYSKVMEGTGKA